MLLHSTFEPLFICDIKIIFLLRISYFSDVCLWEPTSKKIGRIFQIYAFQAIAYAVKRLYQKYPEERAISLEGGYVLYMPEKWNGTDDSVP